MDRNQALKAIRNGAIAATISGLLTLGVVSIARFSNADGDLGLWNDPFSLIDVALILICAFGIYRKSRAAAVVLLVYFILAKIIISLSIGRVSGLLVSLIFLYYFAKAVQGTFVFHKLEKANNTEYRASPRWYYFVGVPVGAVALLAVGFGALTLTGAVPSTEVLSGSELPANQVQILLDEKIIDEGENIEYFYSAGLFSIVEDGNLLTDRRVISYSENENGELEIYELFLPDIQSVQRVQQGDFLNDSIYQVNSYDEEVWLQVFLSTESQGDVKFVEALRRMMDEAD